MFPPDCATLVMCLFRLESQLDLSADDRAKTWKDLLEWLIWKALATSAGGCTLATSAGLSPRLSYCKP